MRIRFPMLMAGTLGAVLASAASGQGEPPAPMLLPLPPAVQGTPSAVPLPPNQQLANAVASQLKLSGLLRDYTVDVQVQGGSVHLSGLVASQPQREEVLRIVQGVPGVERVVNRISLAGSVTSVRAGDPSSQLPPPLPGAEGGFTPPPPAAVPAPGAAIPAPVNEPLPIYSAPMPAYHDLNPPPMPPYAWPTYAPYNNFSRVGYPTAYPYNAWPFIGPFHPFPKVPLGWRSVKLEWDDGYWWYSRTATKYDWWRLRFW